MGHTFPFMGDAVKIELLGAADQSWLEATFARNRARFGDLRMEAVVAPSQVAPPVTPPVAPPAPVMPTMGPNGFPLDTKPADMEPGQQAAYWQHRARQQEDNNKANAARIKELEPLAAQIKALEEASQTEAEKAVKAAQATGEKLGRDAALAEARKTYGGQLVTARLESAAAGKGMTPDALKTLAGDATRFLGDEGVDTAGLDAFLAALPDKSTTAPPHVRPGLGGGSRPGVTATGTSHGADLWAETHKKKPTPA
jgi:hypothetical protein